MNTASLSIDLLQPSRLDLSLEPKTYEGGYNISKQGGDDGLLQSKPKGGILPYTYLWSNGSTEEKITGLTAGSYSLTLTDMNGCSSSASALLIEPTELQIVSITSPTHHGFNVSCHEGIDGVINMTVVGGVPPYTYQWSNGQFSKDLTELKKGNYWVLVKDANMTAAAGQILLTEPDKLSLNDYIKSVYPPGDFNISCYGCSNGSLTANVSGGVKKVVQNGRSFSGESFCEIDF